MTFAWLKWIVKRCRNVGIDLRKMAGFIYLGKFYRNRQEWVRQGGVIDKLDIRLDDYFKSAGVSNGHYFHQDLLVANYVFKSNPRRHIDIASRLDGFVAHVAAFREIEVVDVRPLSLSEHENITFRQADLMNPQEIGSTDSLSCLHAVEHFGLGRYTDPIDINGFDKGVSNLVKIVEPGGILYLSFPIGSRDEVHFNAHRIFAPTSILDHRCIAGYMELIRFDYVDDNGDLHLNVSPNDCGAGIRFGCGIYTFKKCESSSAPDGLSEVS